MDEIFFPSQYKKAILNKTKNTTIRVGKEIGKYKTGKTYLAKSYAGNSWDVKVMIIDVKKITLGEIKNFGIPEKSISAIQRKEKISLEEKVEVIRFKYA